MPELPCLKCHTFVEAVQGIRGEYWEDRGRAQRRRSYRVGGAQPGGAVTVGPAFFPDVRAICKAWAIHVDEQDDPGAHVRALPAWVADCWAKAPRGVQLADDAGACVAAALLGIDVRSVYRKLASSHPDEMVQRNGAR
jgi:hypothetical protein